MILSYHVFHKSGIYLLYLFYALITVVLWNIVVAIPVKVKFVFKVHTACIIVSLHSYNNYYKLLIVYVIHAVQYYRIYQDRR